ncbi:MAG: DNA polymerase III subunit gamma/tau [Elusimicrobia bacterium]|nr:DNA polymerase III subunit gamma/tau [Elusimicrobiota bacterium]
MSYLVLARKYRPKNFDELVGQSHISEVLKNAIEKNRIAHAYIFSGPRGTGKTTAARIFTKALNCPDKKNSQPCDQCPNCKEIADSNSIDVMEIDGASNRGIEEIRALRDNARFAPASSEYKIYIIDEAHQITDAAFNALLKTLEEPPEHVIFILATTDPQKIPLTILSRCQRFKFRPLSTTEITNHLEKLSKLEKFDVDKSAFRLIAQISNGSIRDSLSMLDQVVSFSPDEKVTDKTVRDLIGLSPLELVTALVDLIIEKNAKGILERITQIASEGYDFLQVARDLREYFRKLTFTNYIDIDKDIVESLLPEEVEALKKHKGLFPENILLRNLHLANRCIEEMRFSDNTRLIFELYALKLMQQTAGIDELINKLSLMEKNLNVPGWAAEDETPAASVKQTFTAATENKMPANTPPAVSGSAEESKWQLVLVEIKKQKPLVADFLETYKHKRFCEGEIVLLIPGGMLLERIKSNLNFVEPAVRKIFGEQTKLRCEPLQKNATPVAQTPAAAAKAEKAPSEIVEEVDDSLPSDDDEPPIVKSGDVFEAGPEKHETNVIEDPVIKKVADAFHGKIVNR